ncbi:MAG TPA: BamA/TamA family outer membrane protein, partial [Thermoanaerobaculia bacterium]|nr:BamA/TamA family outer membrane protein [Thermoanaerobaculia bacterium]
RGYRLAKVEPAGVEPGSSALTRRVAWSVEPGPLVELELTGVERKQLERRDLLPFLGDGGYDEALLQQSVGLIRSDFQSRGYYDVQVEAAEQRSEDRLRIRIEIRPGSKWTLEEIDFVGNEAIPDGELERRMTTAPRRLLTPGSGRLVDEVLAEDLSNLRSFYALSGYDRARLGPPRVERNGAELRLVIPIEEGLKHSVADVQIEGLESLDAERTLGAIPLQAGGPFHRLLLEASADRIRSALEEQGYRSAIVSPEVAWSSDRRVASVRFQVLEGDRSTVRAILLRGNTRKDSRVLRRFLGLELGDPISTASLLDVQRRLYRLGVFSRVDVRSPGALGGTSSHEILVDLEEGRTRSVAYGVGYDTEAGARGLLRLSESNLFGRLIRLQGDAIVSQREEIFRALAQQPYLGRRLVDVSVLAFSERESRTAFDVGRRGLQLGLARSYDWGRAGLYYSYRIVELETDAPLTVVPRESLDARVASLTPTALLDHRDDPIDPTRGWSAQAQLERAYPLLAADAEFRKLFLQGSAYLPLGRLGGLALSARAGAIDPIASPREAGLDPIDAVPAAELFFAGGRTSHRAFERDLLGIPGETLFIEEGRKPYPLGGGGLALVNLEWRFPIAGPVGGTLFADGGNVWREVRDFDPADARWGVGAGVRYLSPVGPLRLEIGWKLDRQPWEDPYVWFLSLGNPF